MTNHNRRGWWRRSGIIGAIALGMSAIFTTASATHEGLCHDNFATASQAWSGHWGWAGYRVIYNATNNTSDEFNRPTVEIELNTDADMPTSQCMALTFDWQTTNDHWDVVKVINCRPGSSRNIELNGPYVEKHFAADRLMGLKRMVASRMTRDDQDDWAWSHGLADSDPDCHGWTPSHEMGSDSARVWIKYIGGELDKDIYSDPSLR